MCELPNYVVTVLEDAQKGKIIHEIKAFDSDTGNNGMFDFFIEKASENFQFKIRSSTTNPNVGVIILDWALDREKQQEHYLQIGIKDRGVPVKTGFCQVLVKVLDVNDNAPIFDPPNICGKVMEEESGEPQIAMTVAVRDSDGDGNQCPCMFSITDDQSGIFEIQALAVGNKAVIRSRRGVTFDREEPGKQTYRLEIAVSDGGAIALTSKTTVYIEVTDKNDNEASSGGLLDILFNTYDSSFMGGNIHPLYILDYDRTVLNVYRNTILSGKTSLLSVNQAGMINAQQDIQKGMYNMEFESTDIARSTTVRSSVKVNIRDVVREAIKYAVSIRFSGMRKLLTCNEISYPDFEGIFRDVFQLNYNQTVVVFSIQEVRGMYQTIDVWSYVYSTVIINKRTVNMYMSQDRLVVLIYRYWEEIQRQVGGKIISVGYDACSMENCPTSKCYCRNEIRPLKTYSVFSSENGMVPPPEKVRAFVSIDLEVVPQCSIDPEPRFDMSQCDMPRGINPCLNRGTCISVFPSGYRCNCLPGFDGPQCQKTCRYVEENGYFWLPKLSVFCEGEITFEFSTLKANGLLLYHGPLTTFGSKNMLDFIAIDLTGGRLRIHITQGESKVFVKTMTKSKRLNDGLYHHVAIYKKGNYLRVTVDYCNGFKTLSTSCAYDRQIIDQCEISGTIPGKMRYINGIYPLQIGYIKYTHLSYTFQSFKGNIRNIADNGNLYDLENPLEEYRSMPGCQDPERCNLVDSSTCSNNGRCYGSFGVIRQGCQCANGKTGSNCDLSMQSFRFEAESFFQFTFIKVLTWYERYVTYLNIEVRTEQDGIIFYERGKPQSKQFIILQIKEGVLHYSHNLGDGELSLNIENLKMTDNKWYNIFLRRIGTKTTIEVRKKETIVGYISGERGRRCLFETSGIIFIGASMTQIGIRGERVNTRTEEKKFKGCMRFSSLYHIDVFRGIDIEKIVTIKREKVTANCSCPMPVPLLMEVCPKNTGFFGVLCVDGKWVCGNIGKMVNEPVKLNQMGALIFIIVPLIFFFIIIVGTFLKRRASKQISDDTIYYDGEGKDNVMPYDDEGAGEDDFFNFDLEKLLNHVGPPGQQPRPIPGGPTQQAPRPMPASYPNQGFTVVDQRTTVSYSQESDVQNAQYTKFSGSKGTVDVIYDKDDSDMTFKQEQISGSQTGSQITSNQTTQSQQSSTMSADDRFQRSQVATIDVANFIATRLIEADNECFALIKDTLLHYGYEGEGSDVEDLSELEESDIEDCDPDDFTYIKDLGPQFQTLNSILSESGEHHHHAEGNIVE